MIIGRNPNIIHCNIHVQITFLKSFNLYSFAIKNKVQVRSLSTFVRLKK